MEEIAAKYGEIERVQKIRQQLVEQYEAHAPEKVARVDEMLARFKGKEEELLEEVVKKYSAKENELLPALECAVAEKQINTSLPLMLQDRKLFWSGYLWQHTGGWLSSRQKRWCLLICQHLYIGNEPTEDCYDIVPLKSATVADEPDLEEGRYLFRVTHPTKGTFYFYSENEVEKLMWAVRIEVAILQANPERIADAEARDMYTKVFSEYTTRPCIPYYKNMSQTMADNVKNSDLLGLKTLGAAYLVTKTGDSWLGSNWGRRYIVLYDCWFTIRPEKGSSVGLQIVPLRDTDLIFNDDDPFFTIESDFSPHISIQPDTPEEYTEWLELFKLTVAAANPDRAPYAPSPVISESAVPVL
eukprot:TRINITY_DN3454_c0_g1_i2.p1 TRINITY_DN3454_c0_g1~~TRINITY_DN3454_c0_g1_i2.p1  ORF type:complete len:357 (+),score=76.61 TRINITY_DN3454_c0_g1_i2:301-1371(+)